MFNFFKRKKNEEPLYNVKGIEKLQNSIYELEEQIEKEKLEKLKSPVESKIVGSGGIVELIDKEKLSQPDAVLINPSESILITALTPYIRDLRDRIERLEELLNIKNEKYIKVDKTIKLPKLYGKDYLIKTNQAIIEVLKENKKELHLDEIFNMIKEKKLKNPNVSKETVRTTLYNLLKQKIIKNGKKALCFQIKKEK